MKRRMMYRFRLFIAGDAPNSVQALANLNAICKANLSDQYDIEVVDVFKEPERAMAEGIFMTPTLIKILPGPVQRIVGTLSRTSAVMQSLGLEILAA
jgi:circadian clock protein KaiB